MKEAKLTIIGSRTVVDFPAVGLSQIPAKVDTGAYSSSVWASEIKETDGELSFRLLDRESPLFNGRFIKTKDFEVRLIKNSFGHTEFRYRVPLSIRIHGIRLRVQFTLANRRNNRYPILIGRKSLQGRFLVDVTKKMPLKKQLSPPQILVLVNIGGPNMTEFYEQINTKYERDIRIELHRYRDLMLRVEGGVMKLTLGIEGKDISEYDLVYFKTFVKNAELAAVTAAYAKLHNVPFVDTAVQLATGSDDKLYQYGVLSMYGIRVPDIWYMSPEHLKNNYSLIKNFLQLPFVLKDVNGRKGRHNYLITSKSEFKNACESAEANGVRLMAQKYIENDGDYRAIVLGNKLGLLVHREGDKSVTHLNNTSVGSRATHLPIGALPGEAQKLSIDAAATLQWQVAGVDLIQDKATGEWYCLEVNSSPELRAGAFVDKKQEALVEFLLEETER
jgi:glutathione synthase/RimK-type ligase-like ATP-grasp enzyme